MGFTGLFPPSSGAVTCGHPPKGRVDLSPCLLQPMASHFSGEDRQTGLDSDELWSSLGSGGVEREDRVQASCPGIEAPTLAPG